VSVKHTAFNYLKKSKRVSVINLDEVHCHISETVMNPEESLISAEQVNEIHKAIAALPAKCRLIFKMVKEDGLKYREVATLLNLSSKTIENQMGIALSKIGQSLLLMPDQATVKQLHRKLAQ
jgi:RNA polymerase sigma-70 factor (ECF subfamily)